MNTNQQRIVGGHWHMGGDLFGQSIAENTRRRAEKRERQAKQIFPMLLLALIIAASAAWLRIMEMSR
jgi:hypothetical protein